MGSYTSIILPDLPTPDPEFPPWFTWAFSIVMVFLFGSFILFIGIESVMSLTGQPLFFGQPTPMTAEKEPEPQDIPVEKLVRNFHLVTPPDKSRIAGQDVTLLVKWKPENPSERVPFTSFNVWVDDFLIIWDMKFGNDTWLAKVPLMQGKHQIRSIAFESEFFLESLPDKTKQPGPADWTFFKPHPDTDKPEKCGDCHQIAAKPTDVKTSRQSLTVGIWKGIESCRECHPQNKTAAKHENVPPPITHCSQCHTMH
ncbi:hypothetical protein FACS189419_06650 [Planctomycetales bacterium]|nr:hypothetical protein FACS189419_06650 [Planctomycetales bacterium]